MTSEPAIATSHLQDPDHNGPLGAAKIPLKQKGLDIASQMQSIQRAEPDLVRMIGDHSATVENTLCVIEIIEETLQQKRQQIEEIQARQEVLALEYRQLGRSLNSATQDLAQQFSEIIKDLETDSFAVSPPADKAPEARETNTETNSETASETTSETASETAVGTIAGTIAETPAESPVESPAESPVESPVESPAETGMSSGMSSGLDLETSDLPPVPEFLGGRHGASGQEDEDLRDSGSSSRAWWKHSKKP